MTIAARLAELRKPNEPEFLDDRWYYAGFSQYLKGEAFEHYNRDLADYYKASIALVLDVLETTVGDNDDLYPDARLVLDIMKELR